MNDHSCAPHPFLSWHPRVLFGVTVLVVGMIFAILLLKILGGDGWIALYDKAILLRVVEYRTPGLILVCDVLAALGSVAFTSTAGALVVFGLFVRRRTSEAMSAALVLVGAGGWLLLAKDAVARIRPGEGIALLDESTFSFPSGHAFGATVLAGILAVLLARSSRGRRLHVLGVFLLGVFVLLVGMSRVVLGVHYPSDVLGGFLFGSLWVLIFMALLEHRDPVLTLRPGHTRPEC